MYIVYYEEIKIVIEMQLQLISIHTFVFLYPVHRLYSISSTFKPGQRCGSLRIWCWVFYFNNLFALPIKKDICNLFMNVEKLFRLKSTEKD